MQGRTVTIKLKTIGFEVKSRGTTVSKPISKYQEVYQISCELLKQEIKASSPFPLRLRLMGKESLQVIYDSLLNPLNHRHSDF